MERYFLRENKYVIRITPWTAYTKPNHLESKLSDSKFETIMPIIDTLPSVKI